MVHLQMNGTFTKVERKGRSTPYQEWFVAVRADNASGSRLIGWLTVTSCILQDHD